MLWQLRGLRIKNIFITKDAMMRKVLVIYSLIFFSCLSVFGQTSSNINGGTSITSEYVDGDILIKFKSIPGQRQAVELVRSQLVSRYNSKVEKQWRTGAEHWKVDTLLQNYDLLQIIDSLNSNPFIEYAEPNYILRADVIPNDPSFGDQWALNNTGQNGGTPDADIDAPEAWDITTGDTNIVVGVIDTGIDYDHPDLEDNIWTNWGEIPNNGIDDDNNGYIDDIHGWDFCNNDNDPMDDNGHGTHVAGIIGGSSNNGVGVSGIAWDVRIMALKYLSQWGYGNTSDAVSAIEYANSMGVNITNNSWGGGCYSQTLFDIIAASDSAGFLFIAAAGNDAENNDLFTHYPSCYDVDNIISVASTDNADNLSTFSNWGHNTVDLAAPGTAIYSTYPNNSYTLMDGTSMATPQVSGAAVLIWSRFPTFTNREVRQQLMGSGDQLTNLMDVVSSGSRLNVKSAVSDTCFIKFEVSPYELNFGAIEIGLQCGPKTVSIANVFPEVGLIDSILCDTGFLISLEASYSQKIDFFNLQGNSSDTLNVMFSPTLSGNYKTDLKVYFTLNGVVKYKKVNLFGVGFSQGTIVPGGYVKGVWDVANSPYYINGDVEVQMDSSMVISPGVSIIFTGHYSFTINHYAHFRAKGSQNNQITFTAADTIIGWNGLNAMYADMDTLSYCKFEFSKKDLVQNSVYSDPTGNGGALWLMHPSNPVIMNSYFYGNSAYDGGAIWMGSQGWTLKLIDCTFENNYGQVNVIRQDAGELWINGCNIFNNTSIINGIVDLQGNDAYIINSSFLNNVAHSAINRWNGDIIVGNCLINNNSQNGIAFNLGSNGKIFNNTFTNNQVGLLLENGSTSDLDNNIFWNNTNKDVEMTGGSSMNSNYNNFQVAQSTGNGNISVDPQFIDTIQYELSPSSQCINTGNPYSIYCDSDATRNDMGYTGGNGLLISDTLVDIGILGLSPESQSSYGTLNVYNFKSTEVVIDSITEIDSLFVVDQSNTDYNIPSSSEGIITYLNSVDDTGTFQSISNIYTQNLPNTTFSIDITGEGAYGTSINGNVSGQFTKPNSPYIITNDIFIDAYDTLIIENGVTVRFLPDVEFQLNNYSYLFINGIIDDSVYLQAYDDSITWKGISATGATVDADYVYLLGSQNNSFRNHNYPSTTQFNNSSFKDNISTYNYSEYLFHFGGNGIIRNCVFVNNENNVDAMFYFVTGEFEITNSLIGNNYMTSHLMKIVNSSSVRFSNSTIANNTILPNCFGQSIINIDDLYSVPPLSATNFFVDNSIIWNPDLPQIKVTVRNSSDTVSINNSLIRDSVAGIEIGGSSVLMWLDGNIASNPSFTDLDNNNFHLNDSSLCIDAGDSTTRTTNFDLEGNPRILLNTIDMGAYEFGNYWTGTENSNWFDPLNWKNNTAPDSTSILTVPDATFYINTPSIQSDQKVKKLFLKENAVLEINNGGVLEVVDDSN